VASAVPGRPDRDEPEGPICATCARIGDFPWGRGGCVPDRLNGPPRVTLGRGKLLQACGMWRSLVSAPALGAGGREFESRHPDQECRSEAFLGRRDGGQDRLTVDWNIYWRYWPARTGSR
jgi:hypothetical protein